MCGIFGARWSWLVQRHVDPTAAATAALAALRWRGPDGTSWLRHGDFALGCARLAITEPRSRQPLLRRGARFAVAINGAITNARDLWRELMPRVLRRRELPNDAWLPLLLCARGEPERLHELTGHHALAVIDRERDELWLARDAAGEKPLFVAEEAGRVVAFASTVPALRALGVDVTPSPQGLGRLFRFGIDGAPVATDPVIALRSELAGVVAARAGAGDVVAARPRREPAATVANALAQAVRRTADVQRPFGLALSGGIDSSCIAAELAAAGLQPRAYQFCAVGSDDAERQRAIDVAERCRLPLVCVDGGAEVLLALPALTAAWGLPLGDPSVLAVHALARRAASDGVRVLLAGEGADETFVGYPRHRAVAMLPPWRLPLPAPRPWSMQPWVRLWRAGAAADAYAELLTVTPPAFRRTVLAASCRDAAVPDARDCAPRGDRLEAALAIDRAFYLRWDLLPKLDVALLAAGIEGRCPFLDAEVQAAAAQLSLAQRRQKAPLRAVYAARLPAAVFAAKKRGFSLPLDRWFRGELPWLDLLRDRRTLGRDHLDGRGLAAAIDRHRRGAADLGRALYLVVATEVWLRSREEAGRCG